MEFEALSQISRKIEKINDIYEVDPNDQVAAVFSSADPTQMLDMFGALKEEVAKDNRFPLLLKRKDDYVLFIMQKPTEKPDPAWRAWLLFGLTLAATVIAGATFVQSYESAIDPSVAADKWSVGFLLKGLFQFAIPLLAVVAIHELAHQWAAKRNGVHASWPFFIPLPPPFSLLGTLGAVANFKDPMPTRNALMRIGAAGPVVGFIASLFLLALGLTLSTTVGGAAASVSAGEKIINITIGEPLIVTGMSKLLGIPDAARLHPLALAGWAGMFITAINLLPGGALDGGMVARAFLGPKAKFLGYGAIVVLAGLGIFWTPWVFVAGLLLVSGVVHPQPLNDVTPLDRNGRLWGLAAAVILVLTFTVVPIGL
ncbi:MAG: site-2 protease family protein [Euryarchaeota archaeon]|nr:site-2 protease family protein [Euryarchaeota archaeon]